MSSILEDVLAIKNLADEIQKPKNPHPCFTCDGTNLERFPHGGRKWICIDCNDWAHSKYEPPEESRSEIAAAENAFINNQEVK